MKQFLSIILVSVFFYSIIGFYVNFEIEQFRIKEEVKEKIIRNLPENKLTILKISSCDNKKITWMEDGKEFRYQGTMFDIVRIVREPGLTCYYCYNDDQESNLLTNLDKLVKDQTESSKSRTNQKKQEINYFYSEILFSSILTESPIIYFFPSSGNYSVLHEVLSPPPRISSFIS